MRSQGAGERGVLETGGGPEPARAGHPLSPDRQKPLPFLVLGRAGLVDIPTRGHARKRAQIRRRKGLAMLARYQ